MHIVKSELVFLSLSEWLFVSVFILSFSIIYFVTKNFISKKARLEGLTNDELVKRDFDRTSIRLMGFISKNWEDEE